jgi:hypothetical protein
MGAAISATELHPPDVSELLKSLGGVSEEWKTDINMLLGSWPKKENIGVDVLERFFDKEEGRGIYIDKEFNRSASVDNMGLSNVIWVPCPTKPKHSTELSHRSVIQGRMGDCFIVASLAASMRDLSVTRQEYEEHGTAILDKKCP